MANIELIMISALRVLVEVALLTLLGQGLLALLAGARRQSNPIYQLFQVVTRPVIRLARWMTPKVIVDKHLPFVAFFILFWLWILLAYVKRVVCQLEGLNCF
ncbi:MAG: hypothetical protein HY778_03660 [Betaproteobacteria bacterium]|nr:hypothetical protein [Betaproteobacteria bacterium]